MATIDNFKTKISNSAARTNLFQVSLSGELLTALSFTSLQTSDTEAGKDFSFLCQSSALPGVTVQDISLNYFGRPVYFPGDMSFGTWSTTIINDENFAIRTDIEKWMEYINSHKDNLRNSLYKGPDSLTCKATIETYDVGGTTIEKYELIDVWPSTLEDIQVSHNAQNQIETFSVTWQFNYMNRVNPQPPQSSESD